MTSGSDNQPPCPKLPWMVDFYSTNDGKIPNFQQNAVYAKNYLEYANDLHIESKLFPKRLTAIICTIGTKPDISLLEKMMEEGMSTARIKTSVHSHEECTEIIRNLRKAADNYSKKIGRVYPLGIALDIKGPEILTGSLKNSEVDEIELIQGNNVSITSDPSYEEHVTENIIYVDYQNINEIVVPGDHMHLNDGEITLSAIEIVGSIIRCLIEKTGKLANHASVNLEGIPLDLPAVSDKDSRDIKFGITQNVDEIFLSCVKDKAMIRQVRKLLGDAGRSIVIIAKIENGQGFANIDEIIKESDGILISRGKLSVELPQEKLFIIQKNIIAKCITAGKPVICAPHLLLSSEGGSPLRPPVSELLDVSAVVLETVDAVLLSRETVVTCTGDTLHTLRTLSTLCRSAEAAVYQRQLLSPWRGVPPTVIHHPTTPVYGGGGGGVVAIEPIYALAAGVIEAALKCNAAAIIVTTTSGRAAQIMAACRPRCVVIAVTRYGQVARQLALYRGVDAIQYIGAAKEDWLSDVEKRIQFGITYGKVSGVINAGDCVVTARSSRPGAGFVNSMQIYYASEFDTSPARDVRFMSN